MTDHEIKIMKTIFERITDFEADHGRKPTTVLVDDDTYMTLLRINAGAVRVEGGSVQVFGIDVRPFDEGLFIHVEA